VLCEPLVVKQASNFVFVTFYLTSVTSPALIDNKVKA